MSIQSFITNRKKVQFANILPFGKLLTQGTTTITVAISGTQTTTLSHSYITTPGIFGWARIQSNGNWIPMVTTDEFTGDEFGSTAKSVYIKPFTTATTYGIYVKNRDSTTGYTIDIKYWLYIT